MVDALSSLPVGDRAAALESARYHEEVRMQWYRAAEAFNPDAVIDDATSGRWSVIRDWSRPFTLSMCRTRAEAIRLRDEKCDADLRSMGVCTHSVVDLQPYLERQPAQNLNTSGDSRAPKRWQTLWNAVRAWKSRGPAAPLVLDRTV
jgi:hypothetical protein